MPPSGTPSDAGMVTSKKRSSHDRLGKKLVAVPTALKDDLSVELCKRATVGPAGHRCLRTAAKCKSK